MGIIYLSTPANTVLVSGQAAPLTQVIRRHNFGCGTTKIKGSGYFEVHIDSTLSSTAGGLASLALYQDSTLIATVSSTIAAAGSEAISLTSVVKNTCCEGCSNLSVVYTGPALTASTVTMVIENA